MELRISSIKKAENDLKNMNTDNIKAIIISSYNNDIKTIENDNKLLLNFDDITTNSSNAFNSILAKQIHNFVDNIDFNKYKLYVCCDSGESRSSAVASCILRKYNEDEDAIWKDYNFHPNIYVYDILCREFGLKNSTFRLQYKRHINEKALRDKIKNKGTLT